MKRRSTQSAKSKREAAINEARSSRAAFAQVVRALWVLGNYPGLCSLTSEEVQFGREPNQLIARVSFVYGSAIWSALREYSAKHSPPTVSGLGTVTGLRPGYMPIVRSTCIDLR